MYIFIVLLLPFLLSAEVPAIVREFAPSVTQELGSVPEADEFTRIDFDGDFNPNNNWENMPAFSRPRVVYYDVLETLGHYYLTFGFFFPRDYESWCFWVVCHENDFEGMRLTVEKSSGKALLLETLAHNYRSELRNPSRISVRVQAGGHGIYLPEARKNPAKTKFYSPADYELLPMRELWDRRDTDLFQGTFEYKGKKYPSNFGGQKWIFFGFGAAKPPWSWEMWGSDYQKGQWFLDPAPESKYLNHLVEEFRASR